MKDKESRKHEDIEKRKSLKSKRYDRVKEGFERDVKNSPR